MYINNTFHEAMNGQQNQLIHWSRFIESRARTVNCLCANVRRSGRKGNGCCPWHPCVMYT